MVSFFKAAGFTGQGSCDSESSKSVFAQGRVGGLRCEGNMRFENGRAGLKPGDYKDRVVFESQGGGGGRGRAQERERRARQWAG